jgi:hypothetical protein
VVSAKVTAMRRRAASAREMRLRGRAESLSRVVKAMPRVKQPELAWAMALG